MQHAVLSFGLGVDSTAILLRWILEPESCSETLNLQVAITKMQVRLNLQVSSSCGLTHKGKVGLHKSEVRTPKDESVF